LVFSLSVKFEEQDKTVVPKLGEGNEDLAEKVGEGLENNRKECGNIVIDAISPKK
jgi:hypothetical protein